VRVKYDEHQEIDLPVDRYRERGYQPPFDELPWKERALRNRHKFKIAQSPSYAFGSFGQ
jgi:hypothetical protein